MRYSSCYVTMRDGVRIAIDLYLPAGLTSAARLPAILHQTRYYRSLQLRWPLRMLLGGKPLQHIAADKRRRRRFVASGYAWVDVDVRGSGASFGARVCEWSSDEIRDGAEIVDWIVAPALVQRNGRCAGKFVRRHVGRVTAGQPASRGAGDRPVLLAVRRLHRHRVPRRHPRRLVHRHLGTLQRGARPQRPARSGRVVGEAPGDRHAAGAGGP